MERRPCQAPALPATASIIFLVLVLEKWLSTLSMTVDFLNIAANAARWRYLRLREGFCSPSASSYYTPERMYIVFSCVCDFFFWLGGGTR